MTSVLRTVFVSVLGVSISGCAPILIERSEPAPSIPLYQPKTNDEAKQILNEAGKDIVYGEALGQIGASVLFPPYGIYKLSQAAAGLCGYEFDITQALPEAPRTALKEAGTAVVSAPGRAASWIAGEEYRGKGKLESELRARASQENPARGTLKVN